MVKLRENLSNNLSMFTTKKLNSTLLALVECPYFCVAYSGGLDSTVLLHALAKLRELDDRVQLRAIHVHHGLHQHADAWERHCRQVCEKLSVFFDSIRLHLNVGPGDSVEAVARQARYRAFLESLKANENLVTAHTENDQAETVLLQLLRGAGVKGLSAMPAKKSFAQGFLLRPLLSERRSELEKYAKENKLKWVDDDTNMDVRFNRNYLRHRIFPVLKDRWPEVFSMFSRSAVHCAETSVLLENLADIDLASVLLKDTLLIKPFLLLSKQRQRNLLRHWIVREGFRLPNTKHIEQIIENVVCASAQANPVFIWEFGEVRRFQGRLYLLKVRTPLESGLTIEWDFKNPLDLPHELGVLNVKQAQGHGIRSDIDVEKIRVRFRRGGERCRPENRKETHRLKNLFQEWGVPTWERDRIPLIYYGDELIAVVGHCVGEAYRAREGEVGFVVYRELLPF